MINPFELDLKLSQNGGIGNLPRITLNEIQNVKNEYLVGYDKQNEKHLFKFDHEINNKKILDETNNTPISQYLGAGAFNAVMAVKYLNIDLDQLVIKIIHLPVSTYDSDVESFINKYKEDKILLPKNVPSIFFYGSILNNQTDYLPISRSELGPEYETEYKLFYVMTKLYNTKFSLFNFNNRKIILEKLINCLHYLHSKFYYVYDLKLDNIAVKDNLDIVFIDYDVQTFTCFKNDDKYIENNYFGGTFNPYFAMRYTNMVNNSLTKYNKKNIIGLEHKYDKMDVAGLADIILKLFYRPLTNTTFNNSDWLFHLYRGCECENSYKNKLHLDYYLGSGSTYHLKASQNNAFSDKVRNFVNLFIPLYDTNKNFSNKIHNLLMDPIGSGLLHPNYNNIPSWDTVVRLFESTKSPVTLYVLPSSNTQPKTNKNITRKIHDIINRANSKTKLYKI